MSGTGTVGQREPVLPMGDTGDHGPRSEAGDHGTAEFARGADSDTRGVVTAVTGIERTAAAAGRTNGTGTSLAACSGLTRRRSTCTVLRVLSATYTFSPETLMCRGPRALGTPTVAQSSPSSVKTSIRLHDMYVT